MRLNLSTKGLGVSAGVRGARVSVGPRGTYGTFGRGGFQYRKKLRTTVAAPPPPLQPHPATQQDDGTIADHAPGFITSATAKELSSCSPDEALASAERTLTRFSWFKVYAWLAGAGLVLMFCSGEPVAIGMCALIAGAVAFLVYRWDRDRRTVHLFYDVDDPEIVERLMMANGVGQWLSHAQRVWHIYYAEATRDWKRNAGASTLIRRTPTYSKPGSLDRIDLNIETWAVPVGPQRLLFLPDRLVVQEGQHLAGIAYEQLIATATRTKFVEDDAVPPDTRVLETTWQHVNRDGGPDLRFAENRQLPVVEYGELNLTSRSGLRVVLQFSSPAAPEGAAKVLNLLARRASHVRTADQEETSSQDNTRHPVLRKERSEPSFEPPADESITPRMEQAEAIAVLLRYVAAADRRITDDEIDYARGALLAFCANEPSIAENLIARFRSLKSDDSAVDRAVSLLQDQDANTRDWVCESLSGLAQADGKVTPKEEERLEELTYALDITS